MTKPRIDDLYRAQLSCGAGKDVLEGKTLIKDPIQRTDFALYLMFEVMEHIIKHLEKKP